MSHKEPRKTLFVIISEGLEHRMTVRVEQIAHNATVTDIDSDELLSVPDAIGLLDSVIGSLRYSYWKKTRRILGPDGQQHLPNIDSEQPF